MSDDYYTKLLSKYKTQGVLIDSNLLLLYFVGLYDQKQIPKFKRTAKYVIEDFLTVARIIDFFSRIVTTPNILTEVSNLSGQLHEAVKTRYFQLFAKQICVLDEHYEQVLA